MMFAPKFVTTTAVKGSLSIGRSRIFVDQDDHKGIHTAATTVSQDIARVTGSDVLNLLTDVGELNSQPVAIIVGSTDKSKTIAALVTSGKLDLTPIAGSWETYITRVVRDPVPGCRGALVIAGSDKRGAIYGLYTLSYQIGVSPWHFWSDVPVPHHDDFYAMDVSTKDGPPSIKYRGLFINDEAPALAGWVHEKYGPKFNVNFYKNVFELLLRLRGNFMWPAMWFGYPHPGQSFFIDDALNQQTADEYGIVVSTSHHEPMQRAANEWFSEPCNEADGTWSWIDNREKIIRFFQDGAKRAKPFESYITMGMRGEGDRKIKGNDPLSILTDVLQVQREIIKNVYNAGSASTVPQLIALYKEVQQLYSAGLQIPDDITLLFSDDNYGSIRRLPHSSELARSGGAGIYYHFEYVGHPRSYMWMNSNHLPKIWQQLDHAFDSGARQIWIFNIGDIKPMEIPFTFAMNLAWDVKKLSMAELHVFLEQFVRDTFGFDHATTLQCRDLIHGYDRLMAYRKHDHIEADTFSLLNYNEAERIENLWINLHNMSEALYSKLVEEVRPAFFQLVLHPIKASRIFMSLRVAQAKNRLYAIQRRNSANNWANEVLRLFDADFDLSEEYHQMLNGRWNHILRQPHLGYREIDFAPFRDMVDGVSYVQTRQSCNPIAGSIGITVEGHPGVRPGLCCEEADRTHPTRRDAVPGVTLPPLEPYGTARRWFELCHRDVVPLDWVLRVTYPWIHVSQSSGHLEPMDSSPRIEVWVDWNAVPSNFNEDVLLELQSSAGDFEYVHVPVKQRELPAGYTGYVESDGHVSIEATKFTENSNGVNSYQVMPFLGQSPSGAVALRFDAAKTQARDLEYPFFTFTDESQTNVTFYFTLTLDANEDPVTYSFACDDSHWSTHCLNQSANVAGELPPNWMETVMDCVWKRSHTIDLSQPGSHVLKVRLNEPNCVLEKIVVDLGGVRPSYLGPPESHYIMSS